MAAPKDRLADAWEALRLEILARIDEIDSATPWQSVEPEWWLRMQSVYRAALAARKEES